LRADLGADMSTITVRNIPEDVVQAIKALARANGLSMEQQVRMILKDQTLDRIAVMDHVHKLWGSFMEDITPAEIDDWVEEGRGGERV
jgi:antitoxin FitA